MPTTCCTQFPLDSLHATIEAWNLPRCHIRQPTDVGAPSTTDPDTFSPRAVPMRSWPTTLLSTPSSPANVCKHKSTQRQPEKMSEMHFRTTPSMRLSAGADSTTRVCAWNLQPTNWSCHCRAEPWQDQWMLKTASPCPCRSAETWLGD